MLLIAPIYYFLIINFIFKGINAIKVMLKDTEMLKGLFRLVIAIESAAVMLGCRLRD